MYLMFQKVGNFEIGFFQILQHRAGQFREQQITLMFVLRKNKITRKIYCFY